VLTGGDQVYPLLWIFVKEKGHICKKKEIQETLITKNYNCLEIFIYPEYGRAIGS
jgi:hypothetical protein